MLILQRYLLRELVLAFVAVTAVLFAILFVNQIGTVLARAAQLQYQSRFVLELILIGSLQSVALLLPFGMLLGLVMAFGGLYHNSEMAAAQACGVGVRRVAAAVWLVAVPIALLTAWLDFSLAPQAAAEEVDLRAEALRAGLRAPLKPGAFRSISGGRIVVYAKSADGNGDLNDVFVKRTLPDSVEITVAHRAHYSIANDGESETITLFDGERIEGLPGSNRFHIMRFGEQLIPVRIPGALGHSNRLDAVPTAALVGSTDVRRQAELQWRMAIPLMTLVLASMAVPLSRLQPRQGRYARVGSAILVVALYALFLLAGRSWLEHGRSPAFLGLWWVHGAFALLSLLANAGPGVWRRWRLRPQVTA